MTGVSSSRQRRSTSATVTNHDESCSSRDGRRQQLKLMKHQRRQRRQQQRQFRKVLLPILVVTVLLFSFLDVYYLFDIKREGALSEVKPAFQHQKEQIKHAFKQAVERSHLRPHSMSVDPPPDDEVEQQHSVNNEYEYGYDDSDKEPIYKILEQAGIRRENLDEETRQELPTWTQVQKMYGTHPIIYGLERCHDFTNKIDPAVSFFGIAGTFNSGTNLLAELLIQNCQITKRMEKFGTDQKGMRWQVPWGKHTPVQFREEHVTTTDKDVPLENSFPMIAIRDPYRWLMSMCRHKYTVLWDHNDTTCPHIYFEERNSLNPVRVTYDATTQHHNSLPDLFNEFYNGYLKADFPRVFVRFEDLLFHAENVTKTLCKCGGGDPRRPQFRHVQESAKLGTKAHGHDKTGLIQALIRYGRNDRTEGMTASDLEYAKKLFDPNLMEMFQYKHPQ